MIRMTGRAGLAVPSLPVDLTPSTGEGQEHQLPLANRDLRVRQPSLSWANLRTGRNSAVPTLPGLHAKPPRGVWPQLTSSEARHSAGQLFPIIANDGFSAAVENDKPLPGHRSSHGRILWRRGLGPAAG